MIHSTYRRILLALAFLIGCSSTDSTETVPADSVSDTVSSDVEIPPIDRCLDNDPCAGLTIPCATTLACVPETGECASTAFAEVGADCNVDGSVCTIEQCDAEHRCVPTGTTLSCSDDSDPCVTGGCDALMGCSSEVIEAGADCDDDDACTENDRCAESGACEGSSVDLDDGNPCTADACADGVVTHEPTDGSCVSSDPCSADGVCVDGACVPETPCVCLVDSDCPKSDNACLGTVICDTSGAEPVCTFAEGSAVQCEDPGPCLTATCEPSTGECKTANQDGPCDDGDACTKADSCTDGACASGESLGCDDSNPCTADSCEPATGCVFAPITAGCAACPADSACLTEPCELDLVLGTPTANNSVAPAEPNASLEIVQGPQGGVHLEIALAMTLVSPDSSFVKTNISVATTLGCCSGPPVGNYINANLPLYAEGTENYWISGVVPIVFDEDSASAYVGQTCCVTATVTVAEPTPKTAQVSHTFGCVDWF